MLNPEELLKLAADAFKYRAVPTPGVYALICTDGNLLCVKQNTVAKGTTIIGTISNATIEAGLSKEQWNSLRLRLTAFFKDAEQCPKAPNH